MSKDCVIEFCLEYPKELHEIHNNYPLASDKIEIKKKILFSHQLKIGDFFNIPIGNVKNLVRNSFNKEKYVFHYKNLQFYLKLGLKLKKNYCVLEFNQSQ